MNGKGRVKEKCISSHDRLSSCSCQWWQEIYSANLTIWLQNNYGQTLVNLPSLGQSRGIWKNGGLLENVLALDQPTGCTVMETRFMLAVDVDRRYKHCRHWYHCLPAVIPFYRSTVSGKNGLTARTQLYTWWATPKPTSNTLWVLYAWISINMRDEGSGVALWCKEWPSL